MAKVYVVQRTTRWDEDTQSYVPKFDLSPASEFGEIVILLGHDAKDMDTVEVVDLLHDKLNEFSDADFLLPVGDPCFIGLASAIAAAYNNGTVRMLRWRPRMRSHQLVVGRDLLSV